jgi:hypothetical protein
MIHKVELAIMDPVSIVTTVAVSPLVFGPVIRSPAINTNRDLLVLPSRAYRPSTSTAIYTLEPISLLLRSQRNALVSSLPYSKSKTSLYTTPKAQIVCDQSPPSQHTSPWFSAPANGILYTEPEVAATGGLRGESIWDCGSTGQDEASLG